MLLVLGVPLVEVLGRALAAADTHIAVLAADLEFEVSVPLDLDLPHALLHRNDGLARISGDYPECKYPTGEGVSENTYEKSRVFAKRFPLRVEGEMRGRLGPNSSGLHWWVVPTAVLYGNARPGASAAVPSCSIRYYDVHAQFSICI